MYMFCCSLRSPKHSIIYAGKPPRTWHPSKKKGSRTKPEGFLQCEKKPTILKNIIVSTTSKDIIPLPGHQESNFVYIYIIPLKLKNMWQLTIWVYLYIYIQYIYLYWDISCHLTWQDGTICSINVDHSSHCLRGLDDLWLAAPGNGQWCQQWHYPEVILIKSPNVNVVDNSKSGSWPILVDLGLGLGT